VAAAARIKKRLFKNREAWRAWLAENHARETELWLVYYKKHTGKPSVAQPDAVEEALCYGWIDSIVRTIDDERYMQKYTPRKDKSNWSALNKKRVAKLIRQGKMTPAGQAKIDAAKKNGSWSRLDAVEQRAEMPPELEKALGRNKKARAFFEELAPSHKKQYIWWIASAKRDETRKKRVRETVKRLAAGRKPGMM
jgi:uncharacterized protein YdeI (YjbR/CyaY-like superfamily)